MKRTKIASFAEEIFLQTDFNILLRLSEKDKYLRELIQETGYIRSTVNTILERLLDSNQITRYKNEAGMYLYSSITKLDVNAERYAILDYLLKEHKGIMTPNACRIICVLLDEDKYVIQDLIERGWKPSSLYKNTNKLKENKIIVSEDNYFKLSSVIKKKAIESYEKIKDNISICTYNFDDYCTYNFDDYYRKEMDKKKRIESFKELVNGKDIIAIQEFKVGKDRRWLKILAEYNYKVILPHKYEERNYKSTIAMLLINKEIYKSYERMELAEDEFFPLRYTYGQLTLNTQVKIRLLNLYIPQSCNIPEKRKKQIKELWKKIIQEARKCREINEYFVVLGDLNAFNGIQAENRESFKRLDDIMIDVFEDKIKDKPDWGYTWVSEDGKTKGRLDYIFINSKIAYDYNIIKCNVDDSSLKKEISDHKILKIELKEI